MLYQLDEVQYGEMKKSVGKHHEDNFRTSWPRGQGASPCSFHSMIIEHQFLSQVCKLSVHRWCCKYHCTSANWWWIEYSVAKDFLLESAWVVKVRLWICCCFLDLWDFPALDDIWRPSTFAWLHSNDTGALRGPKVWSTLRLCWRTMGSSQLSNFPSPFGEVHVPHMFKIYVELPLQLVAMLSLWSCSFCRTSSGGSHDVGLETDVQNVMIYNDLYIYIIILHLQIHCHWFVWKFICR